jgi:hypothetical protein
MIRRRLLRGWTVSRAVTAPVTETGATSRRLTPAQVAEIRRVLATGESDRSIAGRFGVSAHAIAGIRTGSTWSERPKKKPGRKPNQILGRARRDPVREST